MHDPDRLADDGDIVEPTPRRHAALAEFQNAVGERVAAPEVVEEPAVKTCFAQRGLNLSDAPDLLVARLYFLRQRARGSGEGDEREQGDCDERSSHVVLRPCL